MLHSPLYQGAKVAGVPPFAAPYLSQEQQQRQFLYTGNGSSSSFDHIISPLGVTLASLNLLVQQTAHHQQFCHLLVKIGGDN